MQVSPPQNLPIGDNNFSPSPQTPANSNPPVPNPSSIPISNANPNSATSPAANPSNTMNPQEGRGEGLRPVSLPPEEDGAPGQVVGLTGGEQFTKVMPEEYRGTRGLREVPAVNTEQPTFSPAPTAETKPAKRQIFSKKIAIILIAILIIGGGVFVYFNWFAVPKAEVPTLEAPNLSPPGTIPNEIPGGTTGGTSGITPNQSTPTPIPESSPTADKDQDGLTDLEETDLGTNLENSDSDGDGMPDGWEHENGLDPLDPGDATRDPDADGLDNVEEYHYNTDPNNSDTDGDSYKDGIEVDSGYDPTKPGAKLEEEESATPKELGVETTPQARDLARKNDLKALELALALYYDDNGFFPAALSDLVPDYVIKVPDDPASPRYSYQYTRLQPSSYELTANIESDNDPDDLADGNADHIYRIKVAEQ